MPENDVVVAVFDAHAAAEDAVKQLRKSGYDITRLSIVTRGYRVEEHVVGFSNLGDRMKHWGGCGALWGGTLGLLFGTALSVTPGIGSGLIGALLVGPVGGAAGGAVAVGALGIIGAGIHGMSLPKDSILKYESAIETDDEFLLVANGLSEATEARDILQTAEPAVGPQRHQGWRPTRLYGRQSRAERGRRLKATEIRQ